ncbi:MAG: MlaD family protein [Pirellulaceae bacterium]|nr:MlaD family protein [Pirellulaceae bacterium]
MDERVLRQRVGVVVLAAALISAFLVARFGDLPLPGAGTYTVYIRFPRAPGVQTGTPVRISGVQIGRVTSVDLLQPTGVRVTTEIDSGRVILDSDACLITTASVLGDSIIEFVPPKEVPPNSLVIEGGTEIMNGQVAVNPLELASTIGPQAEQALRSIAQAGNEVQLTARKLNTAIEDNDDQIPRILAKTERALDQFNATMANIDDAFGDPQTRAALKQSIRELPATLTEAHGTFVSAREALDSFKMTNSDLQGILNPIKDRGPNLAKNIDESLANFNELLVNLVDITEGIDTREGTIGRLLHEDTIYRRLDHALANVEDISSRVRPILDNLNIASDKIARDPSVILKLRSLMDKRPPGAGLKGPITNHFGPPPGDHHHGPPPVDAVYLDEHGNWDPQPPRGH